MSGGLATCGRCGKNLVGFRNRNRPYYVCGSQPYRKGMGCGPGVYVQKEALEKEVIAGVQKLLGACIDEKRLLGRVNAEIRKTWKKLTGAPSDEPRRLEAIEKKIANIRDSIENGLMGTEWANNRLTELEEENVTFRTPRLAPDKPRRSMRPIYRVI